MPGKASKAPAQGRNAAIRVVFITLDNHLSGAVDRAEALLVQDMPGLSIGFHAAADWGRDPGALDAARADIARADIVIATMLFLEDHVRAILPALEARREQCDAMLGLMSAGDIVKLTRMGGYRMDAPARGPLALLKKLRGQNGKGAKPGGNSGAGQMKMLRRLPKILKFIPGTAQDVRHYFLTLQYWLAGSDDNVVSMIRGLIDRYAAGERAALKGTTPAQAPRDYPEVGLYHPGLPERMTEEAARLPRSVEARGTVGVLLLRSYLLGKDAGHYDGMIAALEARGLNVVPAFASGLDGRPAVAKYFVRDGRPQVDAVINLTGFSMVGGPAYNDAAAAEEVLAGLDLPYIAAHPIEFQSLEQWGSRHQGLLPLEATMMVAIPELDGAVIPHVFGGRSDGSGEPCQGCARKCVFTAPDAMRAMQSCPERAESLAAKVEALVALRRSERAKRKLAIVLFNFPPNAGATGSAAHLAVFESLHATLHRLAAEGYDCNPPATVDGLRDAILKGNADRFGSDANVAVRISTDDHVCNEPHLRAIEKQWGPAPGKIQSDGWSIHVLGKQFGNVFVGVQPSFGYEGDPMRLLFDGDFAPTHAFAAFYRWIREEFRADALLHYGTHGALEFMPGKQAGLSGDCWPDRLLGNIPNFYLYAANNPSEAIIAKRRSGATIVSYLTPPLAQAGLYKGFSDLKALVERWRALAGEGVERAALETMIRDAASALDIDGSDIAALAGNLYELERALIPFGLHVLGSQPEGAEREAFLDALTAADGGAGRAELDAKLAANDELGALIHALDGGYVRPAPGGDILHNPQVLPTGRNTHGFDPFRIPSAFACVTGAAQADALLARHVEAGEALPESIAMVLWGTDNLKSEGTQVAQALHLMGARPRFDTYGRLAGAELIPLGELGRPRIDVVATLSGVFRDLLPLQTRMIAEAAWLASTAEEPEALNFIRKHSLAHAAKMGCDMETAALRVFSNAEGAYGAQVNMMIDGGAWADPDELAEAFETHKGYAYGRSGAPMKQRELLETALASVEFTYQNLDSVELGVTDIDQYVDALGGVSRSVTRARGGKAAPVYIVDATEGAAKVRTLAEQIDRETRTRMLNPKWYEGMLRHGFEGVRQIEGHVTTTMGWSATTGEVAPWVFQQISETYVLDAEMRARLATLNPKASARVAERLLEACDRRLWEPDAATLAALRAAADDIEDRLEGLIAAE
ncbi:MULTISPECIES: magnesium chelatase subunit H [Pseudomonadota]|jgi:magnesium chelatase subunit H|uniref:magnesium chelatase subunit H n=1 Tax=Pseudomonadota TaxID=1224 RepID=UPI000769F097|nr:MULTISPECIES: magnesium chelatase subunit H [Pseudomonadota]MBA4779726.1 magnesium chelatase subunit H [Blastomonas sp.]|tara:strand:- start:29239 stop:32871 length:3633 start_codon:yes stop_codon:yes gene_type:complete